jgi:hypothetical protein
MKPLTTRVWSTPLIIATSLVVGVSGLMMFFHLNVGLVKSMHEWLGLLFVAAIVLHLLNHWLPFSRYFSDNIARAVLAGVLLLAVGWMLVAGGGEASPAKRMLAQVQQAPLSAVAGIQQQPVAELVARLRSAGVDVASDSQSLADIAAANKREATELIGIVLGDAKVK